MEHRIIVKGSKNNKEKKGKGKEKGERKRKYTYSIYMGFGIKKFFFGSKNKGPLESRTTSYVHKNRPIVDVAQNLDMKTEFDFMSKPWTVTYTGTAKQWDELLKRHPDALQRNPANTRKNNRSALPPAPAPAPAPAPSPAPLASRSRSSRRKTRSRR